jgi:hypothetical protein
MFVFAVFVAVKPGPNPKRSDPRITALGRTTPLSRAPVIRGFRGPPDVGYGGGPGGVTRRYAMTPARRASAEDRPAFQEADHLLDSALARSMAAAVQRSDRQVDHASACWEDRVREERLDRGVASLDFLGSWTWAPLSSPRICAAGAETGRLSRADPLRTQIPKFRGSNGTALTLPAAAKIRLFGQMLPNPWAARCRGGSTPRSIARCDV